MKSMYKLLFVLLMMLAACSPQRRFTHLVEKYPYLLSNDTIVMIDTIRVYVPGVEVDTVVSYQQLFDTVYLEKDQLKVKVYVDRYNKIYISGQCDTVYVDKIVIRKVPIKYYEKKKGFWALAIQYIKITFWIIFIVVIVYILSKIAKRWEV